MHDGTAPQRAPSVLVPIVASSLWDKTLVQRRGAATQASMKGDLHGTISTPQHHQYVVELLLAHILAVHLNDLVAEQNLTR